MNQLNTVIKTLFDGSSDKELHETLNTFWSEYTKSNNKNDPFGSNEFIWISKYIRDSNSHMWHQKYYLPSTEVLIFLYCRVPTNLFV